MTEVNWAQLDDTLGTDDPTWGNPAGNTVAGIMHGTMPLVSPDIRMSDGVVKMTEGKFGCVGVVDAAGHLMGIITDGDLRRHMDGALLSRRASEVMTWNPVTVTPDCPVGAALDLLNRRRITALFVVGADYKPIGVVHVHDLIAADA